MLSGIGIMIDEQDRKGKDKDSADNRHVRHIKNRPGAHINKIGHAMEEQSINQITGSSS